MSAIARLRGALAPMALGAVPRRMRLRCVMAPKVLGAAPLLIQLRRAIAALVVGSIALGSMVGGAAANARPAGFAEHVPPAHAAADARSVGAAAPSVPFSVVDDRGVTVRFERPAMRIVTLLPSLTETVCEMDACDRLVGTDRQSNWPAAAAALPKLGGGLEDVQIERLYTLRPDVVLAATSARVLDRLEALGLKVLAFESQSLADTRRSFDVVARVLGRPDAAAALAVRMDARIAGAAARIPAGWRGARAYFEVSPTPHAAGEASFIGELLQRLRLGNVVPAQLGPFPKLNPESVVRARPDLVIAPRRNVEVMPRRPGWNTIPAVAAGQACGFDETDFDILVRPGPRMADAAELLAECIAGLPPRPALPP